MKQPDNSNGASGADPQPAPPPLDAAAEEQIEKIVDSIFANHRMQLRDMGDLSIREIETMGQQSRGLIRAAVEQAGVAGLRERMLWMAIGALGAIIGFGIGAWLRFVASF